MLVDAIIKTEDSLYRHGYSDGSAMHYDIEDTRNIEYVYAVIGKYNDLFTDEIKSSFKWRLIYLRAVMDYELLHNNFIPLKSQRIQNALKEICDMYYTTENTNPWGKTTAWYIGDIIDYEKENYCYYPYGDGIICNCNCSGKCFRNEKQ